MVTTLAQRLQSAIQAQNKRATDVAQAAGLTKGALSLILHGKTKAIKSENAMRIADYLNCDPIWLLTGEEGRLVHTAGNAPPAGRYVYKDCTVAPANTGKGFVYTPIEGGREVSYSADFFKFFDAVPESCQRIQIVDDHMFPLIHSGDVLLIDTDFVRFNAGHVYALYSDATGVFCGRVAKLTLGGMFIRYDNTAYIEERFDKQQSEQIAFLGRVLERSGAV